MNGKDSRAIAVVVWRDDWDGESVFAALAVPLPHGGEEIVGRRLRPKDILGARRHGIPVVFTGRKERGR